MLLEQLRSLNIEIGEKEAQTDSTYFEGPSRPVFVMRRATTRAPSSIAPRGSRRSPSCEETSPDPDHLDSLQGSERRWSRAS